MNEISRAFLALFCSKKKNITKPHFLLPPQHWKTKHDAPERRSQEWANLHRGRELAENEEPLPLGVINHPKLELIRLHGTLAS
jgi:hypothetical protein